MGPPGSLGTSVRCDVPSPLPLKIATAIEIGPGSGKYSLMLVNEYPGVFLIAADISASYLAILKQRCAELIAAGRIVPEKIEYDHKTIHNIAALHGVAPGQLDLMDSIDAMAHVDLQFLVVYWLAARDLLRLGGKLIMTVADATRPMGFYRLIESAEKSFRAQDRNIGKFEWVSGGLARSVLGKLGFSVVEVQTPSSARDFCKAGDAGWDEIEEL